MLGEVVLWLTLALPLLVGVGFRVAAAHVFFSLMAGELLARYFGHDISASGYGEIALIVLPMLVTGYLLRFTVSKRRIFVQAVPLLVMGIIAAAFILPVLPAAIQTEVRTAALGDTILDLNRAIIGAMVAIQLITLWVMHRRDRKRE